MENNINNKTPFNSMKKILIFFVMVLSLFSLVNANTQEELNRYEFEQGSGSLALDTSQNDNVMLLLNSASFTSTNRWGSFGLDLDSSNAQTLTTLKNPQSNIITISFWNRPNNNNWGIPFSVYNDDLSTHFGFYWQSTSEKGIFYYNTNNQWINIPFESSSLSNNNWYYNTLTFNLSSNEITYYRNNNLINTITLTNFQSTNENFNLRLGRTGWQSNQFRGQIDSFRIFNFDLNETQRTSLFQSNTITLLEEENDEEVGNNVSIVSDLYNYIIPQNNTNMLFNQNIEFSLNKLSNCDLYINNEYKETYNNVVSFIYPTKNLEPYQYYEFFAFCEYIQNETKFYQISEKRNFYLDLPSKTIEFFIFDELNNYVSNDDLYMVTPCFETPELNKYYNLNKEVYIQKLVNGRASFNLSYTSEYDFCMIKGRINYRDNNFSKNFDLNKVDNQINLGKLFVGENTLSYALKVSDKDLYKMTSPEFWGESWKSIFGIVISLLVGGVLVVVGLSVGSSQLIIVGGVIVALGLGLSLITSIVGLIV